MLLRPTRCIGLSRHSRRRPTVNFLGAAPAQDVSQPGMFQHTLATLRDLFDTYRDQQGNYGVVLDITSTFMAIVERGT